MAAAVRAYIAWGLSTTFIHVHKYTTLFLLFIVGVFCLANRVHICILLRCMTINYPRNVPNWLPYCRPCKVRRRTSNQASFSYNQRWKHRPSFQSTSLLRCEMNKCIKSTIYCHLQHSRVLVAQLAISSFVWALRGFLLSRPHRLLIATLFPCYFICQCVFLTITLLPFF